MTLSKRSLRRVALLGLLLILAVATSCRRRGTVATTGSALQPAGDAPDVVLITLDTVRSDAFGFAGNRKVETPILDRLAAEGLVFDSARASNVVTLPSHANMLTGLYPYQHGIRDNTGFRLGAGVPTLASFLGERGYATGAFVGAFPLDSRYGLDRGFDVYDDRYPPGDSPDDFEVRERPASEVIAAARAWFVEQKGRRRFLWVHLFDAHAPYRPPAAFAARHPDDPYLAEIEALDAALEPLLSDLRGGGGRHGPLVILTSDHGEALGDHGELTHGLFAYEATLKVPLLVWFPGRVPPGRTGRPASHVDVFPTVAGAVGSAPPAGTPGRSLLAGDPGGATYFEALSASLNRGWAPLTGLVEGGYKFIDLPLPELYDLRSDPTESANLAEKRPDVVRRLKGLLPRGAPAARAPAGSEEARRLLSLGYLSGSGAGKTSWTEEDDPKRLVEIDSKIHRVIARYQEGDLSGATRLAREILRERPEMPVAYEFLSFLLQNAGRDAEAAETIASSIRKGLASEAMRVRLALILSEIGRSAEALGVLEPLRGSSDPETQNAVGIVLADAGRLPEAREVFEKVLDADPGDAVTQQNLGIALLKGGDAPGALQRFDRALAITEKLPRAWNAKGVAEARLGDEAGAITSWRRAAEIDPKQFDALFNIGVVASGRGQIAVAREALEKFVEAAPPALYGRDLARARQLLKRLGGA
jgi:arylsulfatase A-like enzyme/tetratricopeptide (TPR) repeat protein